MDTLIDLYRTLLARTDTGFVRYLHEKIDWSARMFGIMGARGVGKTTLLLQHIKLHLDTEKSVYVDAGDVYFSENRLFDFANSFYKNGGKHLFVDEIHKYAEWSKELKMCYDYFPDLQVVFTGSSILDIYRGSDDLSRRALSYKMVGLSFREYLVMSQKLDIEPYTLDEILANKAEPPLEHPLPLFKQYLQRGYYPFYADTGYELRLQNIINQTLENDIPIFAKMNAATSRKLKQLLYIVAQTVPFKPNFNKLAESVETHRNQVKDYLCFMEQAGLIFQLQTDVNGLRALAKTEKIYLDNTNLSYAIAQQNTDIGNMRETFFANQMSVNHKVTSSEKADFVIDGKTFEVGGRQKNQKQITCVKNAFVVKDEIEYGYQNIVPLWAFGLNY
ncbi:MAG: AAA family ATPase [Prevotellaceae bacterium]|jgi:predicted AAA+ superfamily ATPase|nr:AAA family ATPase [Prevotellaceae bacterium]